MNHKPTNPKDALGIKKAPLHCIPCGPLYEVGLAMLEGGRKYGTHNYRAIGTRASVYYDAAMRHLTAWWEGEDIDPDSGIHHVIKAAACIFVVRDSMLMGNHVDDRPVKYPNGLDLSAFNKQVESMIEKYPNCAEPFLELGNKEFVVPEGWEISFNDSSDCGWYIVNPECLHLCKDFQLHGTPRWELHHKYGEAPGYWPTKEAAEDCLKQYLEVNYE